MHDIELHSDIYIMQLSTRRLLPCTVTMMALAGLAWLHSPLPPAPRAAVAMRGEPPPTRGNEDWGRWAHTTSLISIEVNLPSSMDTGTLAVNVADGWLLASAKGGLDDEPLIMGRFAGPVKGDGLTWTIDTNQEAGKRVLCIDIPRKPYPSGTGSAARSDCAFDEGLHIHGQPTLLPGLSVGTMEVERPSPYAAVVDAMREVGDAGPLPVTVLSGFLGSGKSASAGLDPSTSYLASLSLTRGSVDAPRLTDRHLLPPCVRSDPPQSHAQ